MRTSPTLVDFYRADKTLKALGEETHGADGFVHISAC